MRKGLAAATAAAVIGAGLVVAGPVAEAQAASTLACVRVSNNAAGACIYNVGWARYQVRLWDNKCDGHRVYAKYSFEILGDHKFGPETKCGRNYSRTFNEQTNFTDGCIKVCIADWRRDTCSRRVHWGS